MTVIAIPGILREKLGENGSQALVEILNKVADERVETALAQETGKLRTEIQSVRADLIKWMFIFWMGQVATITGILFAFFKK